MLTTTARDFTRKFREIRAIAARGKPVRVTAPEGNYVFARESSHKTCAGVLEGLAGHRGRGFLSVEGAAAIRASKRRPVPARSPWDES